MILTKEEEDYIFLCYLYSDKTDLTLKKFIKQYKIQKFETNNLQEKIDSLNSKFNDYMKKEQQINDNLSENRQKLTDLQQQLNENQKIIKNYELEILIKNEQILIDKFNKQQQNDTYTEQIQILKNKLTDSEKKIQQFNSDQKLSEQKITEENNLEKKNNISLQDYFTFNSTKDIQISELLTLNDDVVNKNNIKIDLFNLEKFSEQIVKESNFQQQVNELQKQYIQIVASLHSEINELQSKQDSNMKEKKIENLTESQIKLTDFQQQLDENQKIIQNFKQEIQNLQNKLKQTENQLKQSNKYQNLNQQRIIEENDQEKNDIDLIDQPTAIFTKDSKIQELQTPKSDKSVNENKQNIVYVYVEKSPKNENQEVLKLLQEALKTEKKQQEKLRNEIEQLYTIITEIKDSIFKEKKQQIIKNFKDCQQILKDIKQQKIIENYEQQIQNKNNSLEQIQQNLSIQNTIYAEQIQIIQNQLKDTKIQLSTLNSDQKLNQYRKTEENDSEQKNIYLIESMELLQQNDQDTNIFLIDSMEVVILTKDSQIQEQQTIDDNFYNQLIFNDQTINEQNLLKQVNELQQKIIKIENSKNNENQEALKVLQEVIITETKQQENLKQQIICLHSEMIELQAKQDSNIKEIEQQTDENSKKSQQKLTQIQQQLYENQKIIQNYEQEIQIKNNNLEQILIDKQNLQQQNNRYTEQIEILQNQLKDSENIFQLLNNNQKLNKSSIIEVNDLEKNNIDVIYTQDSSIQEFQALNEDSIDLIDKLKFISSKEDANIQELQTINDDLVCQLKKISNNQIIKEQNLKQQVNELQQELQEAQKTETKYQQYQKKQVAFLNTVITELQTEQDSNLNEIELQKMENLKDKQKLTDIQQQLDENQKIIENYEQEIQIKNINFEQIQNQLKDTEIQLQKLNNDQKNQIQILQNQLKYTEIQLWQLNNDQKLNQQRLTEENNQVTEEYDSEKKYIELYLKVISTQDSKIQELQTLNDNLCNQLKDMSTKYSKIQEFQILYDELQYKYTIKMNESQNLLNEVKKQNLIKNQKIIENYEQEIKIKNINLEQILIDKQNLQEQNNTFSDQIQILQNQLKDTEIQLLQLKKESQNLINEVQKQILTFQQLQIENQKMIENHEQEIQIKNMNLIQILIDKQNLQEQNNTYTEQIQILQNQLKDSEIQLLQLKNDQNINLQTVIEQNDSEKNNISLIDQAMVIYSKDSQIQELQTINENLFDQRDSKISELQTTYDDDIQFKYSIKMNESQNLYNEVQKQNQICKQLQNDNQQLIVLLNNDQQKKQILDQSSRSLLKNKDRSNSDDHIREQEQSNDVVKRHKYAQKKKPINNETKQTRINKQIYDIFAKLSNLSNITCPCPASDRSRSHQTQTRQALVLPGIQSIQKNKNFNSLLRVYDDLDQVYSEFIAWKKLCKRYEDGKFALCQVCKKSATQLHFFTECKQLSESQQNLFGNVSIFLKNLSIVLDNRIRLFQLARYFNYDQITFQLSIEQAEKLFRIIKQGIKQLDQQYIQSQEVLFGLE